ncbi:MAG: S41 family peptidase [Oscillospiraceae bacterium]|nr:S41 family peptidase [Oscillospiraceae bacterium]
MSVTNDNISDELKIYELSLIWKEAEYNFAFWDKFNGALDWDKAYREALPRVLATTNLYDYYMELSRFLALLRDGHTGITGFPQSVMGNIVHLPFYWGYIDGKHIIENVDKSLDIKQYAIIKKINGIEVDGYIEKNIFPYIWHEKYDSCYGQLQAFIRMGEENSEVEFGISEDGVNRNIKVKRVKGKRDWAYKSPVIKSTEELEELYKSDSHTINKTKDDIAIITISTFMNDKLPEEFYANQKILENMRGFVIDVRYNGGGNSNYADAIAKAFIDGEFETKSGATQVHIANYRAAAQMFNYDEIHKKIAEEELAKNPDGKEFFEKAYKIYNHTYYDKDVDKLSHDGCLFLLNQPLVVLSTCNTGSAAEDFLMELDYTKRATIVGTASNGSTGQPLNINLESGGGFRICTIHRTYPDGRELTNVGVQPHIKCELTLDDYKNGVDSVMNRGLEEIRKLIK